MKKYLIFIILSCLFRLLYAQPISFSVAEISIPGITVMNGLSFNDSGYLVGKTPIEGKYHNFFYDFKNLVIIPFLPGYDMLKSVAISNNNQVGGSYAGTEGSQGFLYANGTIKNIGDYGGISDLRAINNSGSMTGYGYAYAGGPNHAVLYENGKYTDLGTIAGDYSIGEDVNDAGHVTGYSTPVAGPVKTYHAFLYKNGNMIDLGILPGASGSSGNAVNDSDFVVGFSGDKGFVWYGKGNMEPLPVLSGFASSYAIDINNNNLIIGYCSSSSLSERVIWLDGQVYRINDLVEPGYSISDVYEVNNKNQILCRGKNPSGNSNYFILSPQQDEFIVNVTGDESDFDLSDEVADVDPDTPGEQTTLRSAIEQANHNAGKNKIIFNIPGTTEPQIQLKKPLPALTAEIEIDGTSKNASKVEISGSGAGEGANGFVIETNNCKIKGLVITGFNGSGILIQNSNKNEIYGNVIGTDKNGSTLKGNGGNGISIFNGSNNIIGEPGSGGLNVIAGNTGSGIYITGSTATGNWIKSNYIGTDTLGTEGLGNGKSGIEIVDASVGNRIGTGLEKSAQLKSAANVTFGSLKFGNIITKCTNGILVKNTDKTEISGNVVGLFKSPDSEVYKPQGSLLEGIKIINSNSTVISELVAGAAGSHGIRITGPASKLNKIFDVLIGTDPNGSEGMGCEGSGIYIDSLASENMVGGRDSLVTLVANQQYAMQIIKSNSNKISGVSAGITRTSIKQRRPNKLGGFKLVDAARNTIGDSIARNMLAANNGPGMVFDGRFTLLNTMRGNIIGTDDLGSEDMGNKGDGMVFMNGANDNIIGGSNSRDANVSVSNKGNGYAFKNTEGNKMLGNMSGVFGEMGSALKKMGNEISGVLIEDSKATVIHSGFFGGNLNGIRITGGSATGNKISGVVAGTDALGSSNLGNLNFGILLDSLANHNILGGLGKDSTIVVGGNEKAGLVLMESSLNKIQNAMVGLVNIGKELEMILVKNNGDGVIIDNSEGNEFGTPEMPNMVGGNGGSGLVVTGIGSIANKILSTLVGTDNTGKSGLGNVQDGILIKNGASKNIFGGSNPGEEIVTVDNGQSGIKISGQTTSGNSINGAISGIFQQMGKTTKALGNKTGIIIENAQETTIENSTFAANSSAGGIITGIGAMHNKVDNCWFGTDTAYTADIGNVDGLRILNGAKLNTIGESGKNYFTGNTEWGVIIKDADENHVLNNDIGSSNIRIHLKRRRGGIKVENSENNIIGRGTGDPYGALKLSNLIQRHDSAGVAIFNSPGTQLNGNEILENKVGVMVRGNSAKINLLRILQNTMNFNDRAFEGLDVEIYLKGNQIEENMGVATGIHLYNTSGTIKGNLITGDVGDGIALEDSSNPVIVKNNIYNNTGFGVRNMNESIMVNAQQNWWGNATGPGGNGPGSGDEVSKGIDFANWKSSMIPLAAFAERDTVFVLPGKIDTVKVYLSYFQHNPGNVKISISDNRGWITGEKQSNVEFTKKSTTAVLPLYISVPSDAQPNFTNRVIISSVSTSGTEFTATDTIYLSVYQPQLVSLKISPDTAFVSDGATFQFTAAGLDQQNNSFAFDAQWKATGGTISNSGLFTAGAAAGTFNVKVTDPGTQLSDSAVVIISKPTGTDIVEFQEYKLFQNYPNPFSTVTTIKYNIPFNSNVSIRIYTINGVIIKEFYQAQTSGTHYIEWDASGIPAGIYFYSIATKETYGNSYFRDVKKMLILKR